MSSSPQEFIAEEDAPTPFLDLVEFWSQRSVEEAKGDENGNENSNETNEELQKKQEEKELKDNEEFGNIKQKSATDIPPSPETKVRRKQITNKSKEIKNQKQERKQGQQVQKLQKFTEYKKLPGQVGRAGMDFEIKMSLLLYLRGLNSGYKFNLATALQPAGKFDDIVFEFYDGTVIRTLLIQLKHKQKKVLKDDDLFSKRKSKDDFTLIKYFQSYCDIKKNYIDGNEMEWNGKFEDFIFVICTNAGIDKDFSYGEIDVSERCKILETKGKSYTLKNDDRVFEKMLEDYHNEIDHENLREFLQKTVFIFESADSKEIDVWIKRNIVNAYKLSDYGANLLFNELFGHFQKWWDDQSETVCAITHEETFNLELYDGLNKIKSINELYWRNLKQIDIEFENKEIKELSKKMFDISENLVSIQVEKSSVQLCSMKLKSVLMEISESHIFVTLKTLQTHINDILSIWPNEFCPFMIIVLENTLQEDKSFINRIKTCLLENANGKFKVFFMFDSDTDNGFINIMHGEMKQFEFTCEMQHLTEESQKMVLNTEISFQGFNTSIGSIISSEYHIDSILLDKLLTSSKPLEFGAEIDEPKPYHLKRNLIQKKFIKKRIFENSTHVFAVSGVEDKASFFNSVDQTEDRDCNVTDNVYLSVPRGGYQMTCDFRQKMYSDEKEIDFARKESIRRLTGLGKELPFTRNNIKFIEGKVEFEQLCKMYGNVHWLEEKYGVLQWKKTKGDLSIIQSYIKNDCVSYDVNTVWDILEKLIIITSEPGMGKSTFLKQVAYNTKNKAPSTLIIKVNLQHWSNHFQEKTIVKNLKELLILTVLKNYDSEIEKRFLKRVLKMHGKIVLLLDGFDEILPNNEETVNDFLIALQSNNFSKVILTSRHHLKEKLEQNFQIISYSIESFDNQQQQTFFSKYWERLKTSNDVDVNVVSRQIINRITDRKLLENPLHCKMLANLPELNDEDKSIIDMLTLCKEFINQKFELYFEKYKIFSKEENNQIEVVKDAIKEKFIKNHTHSSFLLLLSQKQQHMLHCKANVSDFFNSVKNDEEKTGLISYIHEGRPQFVHRIFAEYLLAEYLIKNFEKEWNLIEDIFSKRDKNLDGLLFFMNEFMFETISLHRAVYHSDLEMTQNLLQETNDPELINLCDRIGRSVLHVIVDSLPLSKTLLLNPNSYFLEVICNIIKILIKHGAVVDLKERVTLLSPVGYYLYHLKQPTAILGMMLESKSLTESDEEKVRIALNMKMDEETLKNILYSATKFACEQMLKMLLQTEKIKENIDIALKESGESPLHTASLNGHTSIVQYLLQDCKADPCKKDQHGLTPVHYACGGGNLETLKTITEKLDVDVMDLKDEHNVTPLHTASQNGKTSIVEYLVQVHSADPCLKDMDGYTSVQYACGGGNLDTLKLFTETFDINIAHMKTESGITPLHTACISGNSEIVEYLLNICQVNPGERDSSGFTPVHYACAQGELKTVKNFEKYLKSNILKWRCKNGNSPLHTASMCGHTDIVKYLMTHCNANPAEKNNNGLIPIYYACERGHLETLKILIEEMKINIKEMKDYYDISLLEVASQNGRSKIVDYLISECDADPLERNKNGLTPLYYACEKGHLETVKVFMKNAKFNNVHKDCDGYGNTPMHVACYCGHTDIVEYLLTECNSNINVRNNKGFTPVHSACEGGSSLETIKLIIETCNININGLKSDDGSTLLHVAGKCGEYSIIKFLILDCYIDPAVKNNMGFTPIHYICQSGNLTVLERLLNDFKIDLKNFVSDREVTPLHIACQYGHTGITSYLIKNNFYSFSVEDEEGLAPVHYACKEGHLSIIKFFTDDLKINVMKLTDHDGNTPLHIACLHGKNKIVEHMLKTNNADPTVRNKYHITPVHLSCQNGHLKTLMIFTEELKITINDLIDNKGNSPLHFACLYGHTDICIHLINSCDLNYNSENHENFTPIHLACQNGHVSVIKALIDILKINIIDIKNKKGNTPLHIASLYGHAKLVAFLIKDFQADPCVKNHEGYTPVHYACLSGKMDVLCIYKDILGIKVADLQANDGNTPAHSATLNGHENVFNYLITECKGDPYFKNKEGLTPFHYLCQNGFLRSIKALLHSSDVDIENLKTCNGITPLHLACLHGHKDIVDFFICNCNVSPLVKDCQGFTPLHCASKNGKLDILKTLINFTNVDIHDLKTDNGDTLLHIASLYDQKNVIEYLVNEFTDITLKNNSGISPVLYSCQSGDLSVVKLFVDKLHISMMDIKDCNGDTPIHVASFNGHYDIVKYLIEECKVDPQIKNNFGFTAVHYACQNNNLDVLKIFTKDYSVNVMDLVDNSDKTPLDIASQYGHTNIVEYLLQECHVDRSMRNKEIMPIQYACEEGNLETLKLFRNLLKENIENWKNKNGNTLLHMASMNGHFHIVSYLIEECGANAKVKNNDGDTPIHYACSNGRLDILKMLLSQSEGSIDDIRNNIFATPLHVASLNSHTDIVNFLLHDCQADPIAKDIKGFTPIHNACVKGSVEILKIFVENFQINIEEIKSNEAITPLHTTAFNGNIDVMKYILHNCKSDPHVVDDKGLTTFHFACKGGHLEVLEILMKHKNIHVNELKCGKGNTLLHIACENGHKHIVKYLLEECDAKYDVTNNEGLNVIHSLCKEGHFDILKMFIELYNIDVTNMKSKDGSTPFHLAILYGHSDIVKYFINECNIYLQMKDNERLTCMNYACTGGHLDIVKIFMKELGSNIVTANNIAAIAPLHVASKYGHTDVVVYLMQECHLDPSVPDREGSTPIHYACETGQLETLKKLTENSSVSVAELKDCHDRTPLEIASYNGHVKLVEHLIQNCKANIYFRDKEGLTVAHFACQGGHLVILKMLQEDFHMNIQNLETLRGDTLLHSASLHGNIKLIKYLIKNCQISPLVKNKKNLTPVHYACKKGNVEILNIFTMYLKFNVMELKSKNGNTPLHAASIFGHSLTVKYLLEECHADPTVTNEKLLTPIHYSCSNGHLESLKILHKYTKCSFTELRDRHGCSPLHIASLRGHDDIIKYLVDECFMDPVLGDRKGLTAIHYACQGGQLHTVKLFLEFSLSNVGVKSWNGDTLLHVASFYGHCDIINFLVTQCKLEPNILNIKYMAPTHYACMGGHLHALKIFSESLEIDIMGLKDIEGNTPLHVACQRGQNQIIKYLVETLKASLEIQNNKGFTPVHHACQNGHLETLKMFYEMFHINITELVNDIGDTVLHTACYYGHIEVAEYLINTCSANYSVKNKEGDLPIFYACHQGYLDILKFFTECLEIAISELRNSTGCTPLHYACLGSHNHLVLYLVNECKLDPYVINNEGYTPIHYTCYVGDLQTLKTITRDLNVDVMKLRTNVGSTVLHLASQEGHGPVIKYLLEDCHADIHLQDDNGFAPIHYACESSQLNAVKIFMECVQNGSIEVTPDEFLNAVRISSFLGHSIIIDYLMKMFDVNLSEQWRNTIQYMEDENKPETTLDECYNNMIIEPGGESSFHGLPHKIFKNKHRNVLHAALKFFGCRKF